MIISCYRRFEKVRSALRHISVEGLFFSLIVNRLVQRLYDFVAKRKRYVADTEAIQIRAFVFFNVCSRFLRYPVKKIRIFEIRIIVIGF